jgi:diaminobutyrate-2-oxoglutarate transaminase
MTRDEDRKEDDMETFALLESNVRTYSRAFPTVFVAARDHRLIDRNGREYIDFFAGAGALNYGHNNPLLKQKIIEYLQGDGIVHSLDMATGAKQEFLERFQQVILAPRGLRYKVQFAGPTGTNAVEAALKLARKVTGRAPVLFFTNAYHGVTLGSLSVMGNSTKRAAAGVPLQNSMPLPYDGFLGEGFDTVEYLRALLDNPGSGLDKPAAVIVETVQAEGGVNVAGTGWLQRLAALLRERDILLVVDDIQTGCGRTGPFFSFEAAGIEPDLVCLSKSISGYGLPMALLLIRPDLDIWSPGEHNGTFRGNNLAFVAGAGALSYWEDDRLRRETQRKAEMVRRRLQEICDDYPGTGAQVRGRGLLCGLDLGAPGLADKVSNAAFSRGLVIESCGPWDNVLKLLPPLTIDDAGLQAGLDLIAASVADVLPQSAAASTAEVAALQAGR